MYVCMCVCIVKIWEKIILLYVTLILSRTHTHKIIFKYWIRNWKREVFSTLCMCELLVFTAGQPTGLFLYYISIYSELLIIKKFGKKKNKEYRDSNAWRSELQPLALSARLRLLLTSVFYESCNMQLTKTLNNNFLQIIDNNKSWFTVNYRKRYIVQHIENLTEGSKMFFPFRSFTPRKH